MGTEREMRTPAVIDVSKELEFAFCESLRGELAGSYDRNDLKYTTEILEDAEKHFPERWKAETKQEFIRFLVSCAELYAEGQK